MKDAREIQSLFPAETLPGTERVFSNNMALSIKCEKVAKQFRVALDVTYTDPASGRTYFQGFGKLAEVPNLAEKSTPSPHPN